MHKRALNVKNSFFKKLSDIEQNLEKTLEKEEYDEKYEKLLNQLEKENLFSKDEIKREGREGRLWNALINIIQR